MFVTVFVILWYTSIMKDTELNQIIGIPIGTIQEWKKSESFRKLLYELLSTMSKEELQKRVEAIKLLKGIS